MTRAKPKPPSSLFPVYAETCGNPDCGHAQSFHIGIEGSALNGKMVACRHHDCACARWVPTWSER